MPLDNNQYILARLVNDFGTAEGTHLPPLQYGDLRVPLVKGLRVLTTQQLAGAKAYILEWEEPEDIEPFRISHFNVYATEVTASGLRSSSPVIAFRSPARLEFEPSASSTLIFSVQTVLSNGLASDPQFSPTTTYGASPTELFELEPGIISPIYLSTKNVYVDGLVLTNNSPSAGNVAWSAHTIYHNGVAYAISSGNTGGTTNKQIYWDLGNTTLTAAASLTPAINRFPIATNVGGTGDTSWNKLANQGVVKSNMAFALLEGFQLQPSANLLATDPVFNYDGGGATALEATILTVNQACALLSFRVQVVDPFIYNLGGPDAAGDTNLYLKITVDGATSQSIKILHIPAQSGTPTSPQPFAADIMTFETFQYGWGYTAGDFVTTSLNISATTSLDMKLLLTSASRNNTTESRTLLGDMLFSIGYALKV